ERIVRRFWEEGRLKLEPWLAPRIARAHLWPRTELSGASGGTGEALALTLSSGQRLIANHVIVATGYRVDLARVPLLAQGNLLPSLEQVEGFPRLDEHLQTTVPGLYLSSLAGTRDFGPFFGFTVSARMAARLILTQIGAGTVG